MQFTTSNIIAASQLFALAMGAPLLRSDAREARSLVQRAAYKVYGGDGSTAQGWPDKKDWAKFEDMWTANQKIMSISCTYHGQPNDSPQEMNDIKSAIQQVAKETSIDERVLLATAMQESNGCLRVKTTDNGNANPGLMQSFKGKHNCYGVNPCPKDQIIGMIRDGAGVGSEVGISQNLKVAGGKDDAQTFYKAARIYNSGHAPASGNLGLAEGATACYVSDFANRLMGWAGDKTPCTDAEAAKAGSGPAAPAGGSTTPTAPTTPSTPSAPATNPAPVANKPAPPPAPATKPAPAPATKPATKPANAKTASAKDDNANEDAQKPAAPTTNAPSTGNPAPGASSTCKKWYSVKQGDTCESTGLDMNKLTQLNTEVDTDCSNLWAGYDYCVE